MIRFILLLHYSVILVNGQNLLGDACGHGECTVLNSACLNGICQCTDGYFNDGLKCVKIGNKEHTLDLPCKKTADCRSRSEICLLGQCKCSPSYVRFEWNCWPSKLDYCSSNDFQQQVFLSIESWRIWMPRFETVPKSKCCLQFAAHLSMSSWFVCISTSLSTRLVWPSNINHILFLNTYFGQKSMANQWLIGNDGNWGQLLA